jgi:thiamine pyrophosphate-dependent acetolactate synthase large subunit-like protein
VLRNLMESYEDSQEAMPGHRFGIDLSETPDFAMIARGCRAHGETVVHPDDLQPALERALSSVESGRASVVDVRTGLH